MPSVASGIALLILFIASINHSNTTQVAIALSTATLVPAGVRFYLALQRMTQLANEREQERLHAAEVERETQARAAEAATTGLGTEAFDAAYAGGRSLTRADAVALVP